MTLHTKLLKLRSSEALALLQSELVPTSSVLPYHFVALFWACC